MPLIGAKLAREDLKLIKFVLVLVPLLAVHLIIMMRFFEDLDEIVILQVIQYRVKQKFDLVIGAVFSDEVRIQ